MKAYRTISNLPRYSFMSPPSGGVTRVPDKTGAWIERHEVMMALERAELDQPQASAANDMLAVRTGHKPIDIDDMLAVCIPGGSSCDPQDVADSIREYWRANGGGMSTQIKAMSIQPIYRDLWPELTKAACAMVHAHMDNETMVPALDDVAEQFPDLTRDQLTCLWMGVNAKDREGLVGA